MRPSFRAAHVAACSVRARSRGRSTDGGTPSKDPLKRRIDEAARYVPRDRLGLSPQCGFASGVGGNPVTEGDEKRKLALVVEVAHDVWGTT